MTWRYCIMHKEAPVAIIQDDGLCSILSPSFMPFNLYLEASEEISVRINNLDNFYHWCASRVLTLDRKYAKEILNSIGATQGTTDRDRAQLALSYHCVTLTDVFWTKSEEEDVCFADINLYANSLSDAFVEVSLFGKQLTLENTALLTPMDCAGDVSTQGAVPKAWIRRNGVFYLLKDGGDRDIHAELLASKIAKCFHVDAVEYEPRIYNNQLVSCCAIITSLQRSIAPISHVEIYAANHDTTVGQLVDGHDAYSFHMMNILDYLIGNTDRHWGNWGFFVDNETNQLTRLHSLMDFNKAFLAYDTVEGSRCLTLPIPMSQMQAAKAGVEKVGLNQAAEVQRSWFGDDHQWQMFNKRLEVLDCAARKRGNRGLCQDRCGQDMIPCQSARHNVDQILGIRPAERGQEQENPQR